MISSIIEGAIKMNIDSPILITGCPRSGTSLIAGIINLSGADGGEMYGECRANKKGMFENKKIREEICKPFLRSIAADPLGQDPLPNIDEVKEFSDEFINNWREKVLDIISNKKWRNNQYKEIWFYKGAKMCLMWPIWHRAFPDAKWIVVRREDEKIIDSCLNTPFMRAFQNREDWQEWIGEHKKRFEEMKQERLDIIEIWTQDIINGQFESIKNFIEQNGLFWNEEKVRNFISKELWH